MTKETALTADEVRILDALLVGRHPVLEVLRFQQSLLSVSRRERSDGGFHIHFQLPAVVPRLLCPAALTLADVVGHLSGVHCGFILWVRGGTLCDLEGHVWDAGEIPVDWRLENLAYLGDPASTSTRSDRDLKTLLSRWTTNPDAAML